MTSNVDGHFQRAGFDSEPVYEVHGSIHHLQCSLPCDDRIWSAADLQIGVDMETMGAKEPLPNCPSCGAVARPNILMFGDWSYLGNRNDLQRRELDNWLKKQEGRRVAVAELGAGSAVPTVRMLSEEVGRQLAEATLIRINPREPEVVRSRDVSISTGALEAIQRIEQVLS